MGARQDKTLRAWYDISVARNITFQSKVHWWNSHIEYTVSDRTLIIITISNFSLLIIMKTYTLHYYYSMRMRQGSVLSKTKRWYCFLGYIYLGKGCCVPWYVRKYQQFYTRNRRSEFFKICGEFHVVSLEQMDLAFFHNSFLPNIKSRNVYPLIPRIQMY